ncbi:MAG: FumA C-terminus/TtdB family hydratase beta subunit [Promethearchaeota archaeon]
MVKKILKLPVLEDEVRELNVGDIVFLNGLIMTGRDHVHKRIVEYIRDNREIPEELKELDGSAIYHCGPIIKEEMSNNKKEYKIYSGGPTTSARMEEFQEKVCNVLNIRLVIGKGGMENTNFKRIGGAYLSFTGGCGAIFVSFIKKVKGVIWEDLGMPEAIWLLEVQDFGPLLVTQDSKGNSLYI